MSEKFNPREKGLGAIRTPEEMEERERRKKERMEKQIKVSTETISSLPSSVDLRPFMTPIIDQGRYNSCVACALTSIREYYNVRSAGISPSQAVRLSPMYIYNSKGANTSDGGIIIGGALALLKDKGVCEAVHWPYPTSYNPSLYLVDPTNFQFNEAKEYEVPFEVTNDGDEEYSDIIVGLTEFKKALSDGQVIFVAFGITAPFDNIPSSGIMGSVTPQTIEPIRGNHAAVIVGYDDNVNGGSFILQNSWGTRWGDNGFAYITYQDMAIIESTIVYNNGSYSIDWNATVEDVTGYIYIKKILTDPIPPQNVSLRASVTSNNQVLLSMTAKNATGIHVYRNGERIASLSGTATSYTDSTVVAGQTYKYYIEARNSYGTTTSKKLTNQLVLVNGDGMETITVGQGSAPSTPTMSITGVGQNSLTLTYSATGATSYDIYRNGTRIVLSRTSTSYTDTGLSPNTAYSYYVVAKNTFGSSTSITRTVTTLPQSVPGDSISNPIVMSGSSATSNLVAGGAVYFRYVPAASSSYTFDTDSSVDLKMDLLNSAGSVLATDDDGDGNRQPKITYSLTGGSTYYLKVYGYSSTVAGSFTLNVQSSGGTSPGTPTLTVGNATTSSLTLTYSASGATSYDIYRNGSRIVIDWTSTTYTDTGLTPGTSYTYYIVAKNAYGQTTGTTKTASTLSNGSVPGTPSLSIGDATTSSLTLTYSATGATTYDIYRNGSRIAIGRTSTSYTDTGLAPETTYTYYVVAKNSYGQSTSSTRSASTLSSGGRLTTITEDFQDTNYQFTFTGDWSRSSISAGGTSSYTMGIKAVSGTVVPGFNEAAFTVDIPANASGAKLTFDALVNFDRDATPYSYLKVLVNGVERLTLNANGSQWYRGQQIVLGTGPQTIRFQSWRNNLNSNYTFRSYIDNIQVEYYS